MAINFIIESLRNNRAHGILIWQEMGLESIAVSGPYGRGELPDGTYEVPGSGLLNKSGQNPYCDSSGNCWFQFIEPQFSTNRSELGIHPDGNVPGTRGCIGLLDSDTSNWYEAFKSIPRDKSTVLEVSTYYV